MENDRDYHKDLEVDFYSLHENWKEHAGSYMYWAEMWANAVNRKDLRKQFLSNDIRENPTSYGIPPGKTVSEAAVTNLIDIDDEYIKLSHEVNIFNTARKAFEHRRASLDGLTTLFVNSYFSSNDIPVELKNTLKAEMEKQVRDAQKKAINKPTTKKKLRRKRT